MANTAETLKLKSENLKASIVKLIAMIRDTNDEITAQIEQNEESAARMTEGIDQLRIDNETLAVLRADNETFISQIEKILGN